MHHKQLQGYGHMQLIEDHTLLKRILIFHSQSRRRQGRPKHNWTEEIMHAMAIKYCSIKNEK